MEIEPGDARPDEAEGRGGDAAAPKQRKKRRPKPDGKMTPRTIRMTDDIFERAHQYGRQRKPRMNVSEVVCYFLDVNLPYYEVQRVEKPTEKKAS